MLGRAAFGLFLIILILGPFRPMAIDGFHGWRTLDTTQSYSVSVPIDSANVTLSHDLFQADKGQVETISSNITGSPAPADYNEISKVLLIAGLNPGLQTLTVRYYAETEDATWRILGPFLIPVWFLGTIGIIIWIVIAGGKKK